ncbi:hypothetical protein KQI42_00750 [Tissierella sp. MSJ-40]|uniref:SMODS-associating 2TM beta-strand rich effector domain-containing protein n=1 Tax=Tissierella simiarum TaxID=2841534 RepID=A0ABS6E142_9FIRM|nr:hypothetical protein [Tissierella simiarum]MBU5436512.1 hypothetical protein [Tissierella simiarum]
MSYEFWIEAEKFLYDSFFINLIILGFVFIFIINRLSFIGYNNSKTSNIIFFVVIILFIVFSTNTIVKFNKYKILYEYDRYVNYGIRNNKRTIAVYKYPNGAEKDLYSRLYLVDSFRKVSLYDEEKTSEDVEFLGRDGDNFYFQEKNFISYRELGDYLEIVDNISTPIREGIRFYLKDSRFKDIGFKEKSSHPYLLNYKIPKNMENKKFENPENIKISRQGEFTSGWINPTFGNKLSLSKDK